jgi:transposase-like protein
MPERIALRDLTAEERDDLERIARARTAPAHLVERATPVLGAADGHTVGRIAHEAGVSRPTVSAWVRRFNDRGLAAPRDRPRSGRPSTYGANQWAAVVAAAPTDPKEVGLPFAS